MEIVNSNIDFTKISNELIIEKSNNQLNVKGRKEFLKKLFFEKWLSLLLGIIVGIVFAIHEGGGSIASVSLLNILSAGLISFLTLDLFITNSKNFVYIKQSHDYHEENLINVYKILESIQILSRFENKDFNKFHNIFESVLKRIIGNEEDIRHGGGYVVHHIDAGSYTEYLKQALQLSSSSYCATLAMYNPSYFFDEYYTGIGDDLAVNERKQFLKDLNDEAGDKSINAYRVVICNDTDYDSFTGYEDMNNSVIPKWWNEFKALHSNFNLFIVKKSIISRKLSSLGKTNESIDWDYAIFDESLILMQNSLNRLEVLSKNNNPRFNDVFSLLNEEIKTKLEIFKLIKS